MGRQTDVRPTAGPGDRHSRHNPDAESDGQLDSSRWPSAAGRSPNPGYRRERAVHFAPPAGPTDQRPPPVAADSCAVRGCRGRGCRDSPPRAFGSPSGPRPAIEARTQRGFREAPLSASRNRGPGRSAKPRFGSIETGQTPDASAGGLRGSLDDKAPNVAGPRGTPEPRKTSCHRPSADAAAAHASWA